MDRDVYTRSTSKPRPAAHPGQTAEPGTLAGPSPGPAARPTRPARHRLHYPPKNAVALVRDTASGTAGSHRSPETPHLDPNRITAEPSRSTPPHPEGAAGTQIPSTRSIVVRATPVMRSDPGERRTLAEAGRRRQGVARARRGPRPAFGDAPSTRSCPSTPTTTSARTDLYLPHSPGCVKRAGGSASSHRGAGGTRRGRAAGHLTPYWEPDFWSFHSPPGGDATGPAAAPDRARARKPARAQRRPRGRASRAANASGRHRAGSSSACPWIEDHQLAHGVHTSPWAATPTARPPRWPSSSASPTSPR